MRSETEICFRQVRSSKKFSKNALIIMTCPHPRASGSKKVLPAHTNAFPPNTRRRYFFLKNQNSNLPPTTGGVPSFDRVTQKRAFVCSTHIYSRKPAAPAFEWGKNRSVFEKKYSFRPLFMPNRSVRSCVPAALMQADAFGKRRGNLLNLMRNDIVLQY